MHLGDVIVRLHMYNISNGQPAVISAGPQLFHSPH